MTANRISIERPAWTDYFIGLAFVAARRSHDAETQHGCIITDAKHRVIGTGYNGFPRGVDDLALPNIRPPVGVEINSIDYKYPWMLHSERNAISNCIIRPDNGVAYVTGQCCNDCIMALWQAGIVEVYMADLHGSKLLNENTKAIFDEFVQRTGMKVSYVKPNLTWLSKIPINA